MVLWAKGTTFPKWWDVCSWTVVWVTQAYPDLANVLAHTVSCALDIFRNAKHMWKGTSFPSYIKVVVLIHNFSTTGVKRLKQRWLRHEWKEHWLWSQTLDEILSQTFTISENLNNWLNLDESWSFFTCLKKMKTTIPLLQGFIQINPGKDFVYEELEEVGNGKGLWFTLTLRIFP